MDASVKRGKGKFYNLDDDEIFNVSGIADIKYSAGMFKHEEMSLTPNEIGVKDKPLLYSSEYDPFADDKCDGKI